MFSKILVSVAASASVVLAATPPGFEPGSQTSLLVTYGDIAALDGVVVAQADTQSAPTLATQSKLDGTSFAVLMIDLDIPTDNPPETNTLLHWMQTGLTQSSSATSFQTTTGSLSGFVFSVPEDEDAFAPYLGPAPPAKIPLSHRYTQIVVDTTEVSEAGLAALNASVGDRLGFDVLTALTSAGLEDKVLAGNFFNVTNPGNASSTTNPSNSSTGSSNTTTPSTTPSQSPITAGAVSQRVGASVLAVAMAGVMFFAL